MRVAQVNGAPALLGKQRRRPFVAAEFWVQVDKANGDGCWIWCGRRGARCYGRFAEVGAHRAAWYFSFGPVPDGMFVCHRCDNPTCVRPDHLFLGTPADNVRDMDAKGRRAHGETHPASRLTLAAAREIRSLGESGLTVAQMGQRFGVNRRTILHVLSGHTWKETA